MEERLERPSDGDEDEEWGIRDGVALRAVPPLVVEAGGLDPWARRYLAGRCWRLDLSCDWTLQGGGVTTQDRDGDVAAHTGLEGLVGRTVAAIRCPDDAYEPVLTFDNGSTLAIVADRDGDPWHLTVDGVIDLEGIGPGDHALWLAGDLADDPC